MMKNYIIWEFKNEFIFKKNINIRFINVEINLGYGSIQTMWFNSYS